MCVVCRAEAVVGREQEGEAVLGQPWHVRDEGNSPSF